MPTVRSLEERLDDLFEQLEALKGQLANVVTTKLEPLATSVGTTQTNLTMVTAQLATLQANLTTVTAQLAVLTASLNDLNERLKTTSAKLDGATTRLEELFTAHVRRDATVTVELREFERRVQETTDAVKSLNDSHREFKAKAETTFGITRWIGVFAATALLAVLGSAFTVIRAAGNLESNVQQQQKTLDQQQKTLEEIRRDLSEIRAKQK